jgi:hypothetical protein
LMFLVPPFELFLDVRRRSLSNRIDGMDHVHDWNRPRKGIRVSREANPGNPRLDHPHDPTADPFDTRPYPRPDAVAARGLGAASDAISCDGRRGGACRGPRVRPASRCIHAATHAARRIDSGNRGWTRYARRVGRGVHLGRGRPSDHDAGDQRHGRSTTQTKGDHEGAPSSAASKPYRPAGPPFGRLRTPSQMQHAPVPLRWQVSEDRTELDDGAECSAGMAVTPHLIVDWAYFEIAAAECTVHCNLVTAIL